MVFRAKDGRMLERLKEGDKIKIATEEIKGVLVVTRIEAPK